MITLSAHQISCKKEIIVLGSSNLIEAKMNNCFNFRHRIEEKVKMEKKLGRQMNSEMKITNKSPSPLQPYYYLCEGMHIHKLHHGTMETVTVQIGTLWMGVFPPKVFIEKLQKNRLGDTL